VYVKHLIYISAHFPPLNVKIPAKVSLKELPESIDMIVLHNSTESFFNTGLPKRSIAFRE